MSSCRVLHSKRMKTPIMAAKRQSFVRDSMASHVVHHRQYSIDLNEVGIAVLVLCR
jgi:hypothetical protein